MLLKVCDRFYENWKFTLSRNQNKRHKERTSQPTNQLNQQTRVITIPPGGGNNIWRPSPACLPATTNRALMNERTNKQTN